MTLRHFPRRYRPTLDAVCRLHSVATAVLLSPNRTTRVVNARRVCAKLLRWQGMSLPDVGVLLNRDHSSLSVLLRGGKGRRGWASRVKLKNATWAEVGYSAGGKIRVRTGNSMGSRGGGATLDVVSARRFRRELSAAIRYAVAEAATP